MADNQTSADLKGAIWVALTNGHYHSQRESFLGFVDRAITFLVLVAGAGAVASGMHTVFQNALTVAVMGFALLQLVFELGPITRKHASFKAKYFSIASDLELGKIDGKSAHGQMMLISGEEGPIYCAVHALSQNWASSAVYGEQAKDLCQIVWVRRLTRHFWRQSAHDFHS